MLRFREQRVRKDGVTKMVTLRKIEKDERFTSTRNETKEECNSNLNKI